MVWLHLFALGFFLFAVESEKEGFQSNIKEQTKGTAVTKDKLLKTDNPTGRGTEATENTHRHTTVAMTAEFPHTVLFDRRSTRANERITRGQFFSQNLQKSVKLSKPYPSAKRTHRESSKSERILSSTQAATGSVLNDTSEPQVHLSAAAERAPPWFHALPDDRNRGNANSVTLTSADAGLGVPILSASHPHVIDNPSVQLNGTEDKQSQGEGITNLGRNVFLSGTMQSILQNGPGEDSRRGSVMTDSCLTCLKDGKAASIKKSAALLAVSPYVSSDTPSTDGFALNLNNLTASLQILHQQSAGEHKEKLSKEIRHRNVIVQNWNKEGELIYTQRGLPSTFNASANHAFLNNSKVKTVLSVTEFDIESVAEITSAAPAHLTQQQRHSYPGETFVPKELNSTSAELLYTDGKPVKNAEPDVFSKIVSTWNPRSKLNYSSKSHKNASHSLSTNLKNQNISNAPVSNLTFIAKAPHSSCTSVLPKGRAYSTASPPSGSTNVIEARGPKMPLSSRRPTASAVKNLESSTDSFIFVQESETISEPNSKTKAPILTLPPKDSIIKLASATQRDVADRQDSQAFTNEHRIVKQASADPPRTPKNKLMKKQQVLTFAAQKVTSVRNFVSSQQDLSDDLLVSMLINLPRTKNMTSEVLQGRGFDYNGNYVTDLQGFHDLKPKDRSEQVYTVVAKNKDNTKLEIEGNSGGEVQKTEETLEFQDEEGSMEDEMLENKSEEVLVLDKAEGAKVEKIINSGAEINGNTDREAGKMEEHAGKTSREEHVTLRQDKDPRQGEVKEEEGDGKRKGVTKINTEHFTQEEAEMQRESSEEKGSEAGGKEQSSRKDMKCKKETVKEDMTNVPLEHTTNWKEVNKEPTVENLSSCHRLIKELKAAEHEGIHLSENTSQKEEITNKSFSYTVTSNHQPRHLSPASQRPKQSVKTHPPEELYTRIAMRLSTHTAEPPEQRATSSFSAGTSQKKEAIFSISVTPKSSHTSGASASKFRGILKPQHSPQSIAAKAAKTLSVTAGFQRAQRHFTVNTSLNVSIIHSIADHRHKFNTSVLRASTVLHMANEREQAEYITPSMNPARHQQMHNGSSTKPRTVTASSSVAYISTGQVRPRGVQPATQRSQSSSCSDTTPGCAVKLSVQTSHPNMLHTPADDNKQGFLQVLTLPMSPEAEIDQLPVRRKSPEPNVRTFGGDSSPVTYGLEALEGKSLQDNFDSRLGRNRAESFLATTDEAHQGEEEEIVSFTVTPKMKQSNPVKVSEKTNKRHGSPLLSPITDSRIKQHANNSDELNLIFQNKSLNDFLNANGKDEVNKTKRYQLQRENTTRDAHSFFYEKTVTADQTETTAFVDSDVPPELTETLTHDFLNLFVTKQDKQSPSAHAAKDDTFPAPHLQLNSDPTVHRTFSPKEVIITIKTSDYVSIATPPNISNNSVSADSFKSMPSTSAGVPVTKKSPLSVVVQKAQSNSHSKPLSLKGLLTTSTPGKPTPAVKRTKTTEAQSERKPEHEIFEPATEPSRHDLPAKTAISRPIREVEPSVRAGFLKTAHRAGRAHGQTSAVVERMRYSSIKDIKSALTTKSAAEAKHPPVESISRAHTRERAEHGKHTLPGKTSISQAINGAVTDSVPPAGISPTEIINKTGCRTIGCAKSGGTSKTTSGAGVMDHTGETYKERSTFVGKDRFMAENSAVIKQEHKNQSANRSLPGRSTLQVFHQKEVVSPVTSKSERDSTSADYSRLKKVKRTSDKTVHLEGYGTSQRALSVAQTTRRRFHRETFRAQEASVREATPSEPDAAAEETTVKSTEQTLLTERNTKTQLDRRAGKARIFEVQNASRSPRAHAKEETARPESGSRLLLSELGLKSELNQRRRTSPHLYLPGVAELSDDLCGSGNYTAEMSLKLGRAVEPGDAVPARGNVRVFINLKTNNSQINLGVTSCCLSPTIQPDLTNSTCCLFSRLAAEPSGITLLPSALSTSASFTISLFQMINYSVVYLHCDLSVCLRNHSDCERQCLQQRSAFPSHGPGTIVANLRNRISFGPMLKQAKNSTFPEEIDLSKLDLVLVVVSLAVGLSLTSMMLLLVWLAYHRRAIWLLRSAATPQSCCGCRHPGGDLISP